MLRRAWQAMARQGGVAFFNVALESTCSARAAQGSASAGQLLAANEEHRTIFPKTRLICACAVQREPNCQ